MAGGLRDERGDAGVRDKASAMCGVEDGGVAAVEGAVKCGGAVS